MRKLVLLISLLVIYFIPYAQKLDWVAELKTPDDSNGSIILSTSDAEGGVIFITGVSHPKTLEATNASIDLNTDATNSNGLNLVRLDVDGQFIFQTEIKVEKTETNGYLNIRSLIVDGNGDVFLGGFVSGSTTITIGETDITFEQPQSIRKKGLILKLSNSGELLDFFSFDVEKDFYSEFLSMDINNGKLYILYALIDLDAYQNNNTYLLTEHISILDENWTLLKSKSFNAVASSTTGLFSKKQFLMNQIEVYDESQIYLSGFVQNGQESDLSEDISVSDPAFAHSIVKLNANLEFLWFRGVQTYKSAPALNMGILSNGDVVLNTQIYSLDDFPTSLIGNSFDEIILPYQSANSFATRQVFLDSEGNYKFQTMLSVNGNIDFGRMESDDSDNIYIPISGYDSNSLKFFGNGEEREIFPKSTGISQMHNGYIKISKSGAYQSHNLYELSSSDHFIDNQRIHLGADCESFLYLARYGSANATIDVDFDFQGSSEVVNSNNTYDYFIAHYSNNASRILLRSDEIVRSGNEIKVPFTFSDESLADLTFEITSSNESVISTENIVFNLDGDKPNIVVHEVEGAIGSADISITLIDACNSYTNTTVSIDIDNINDVPIFNSNPLTRVKEPGQYIYGVSVSDHNGDELTLSAETLPGWITLYGKNAVITYSGSGYSGFDNGRSVNATFNVPIGAAVDSEGNVYVADLFNHVIRKVSKDGQVTTRAGTGNIGYADGPSDEATFNEPSSIAIDSEGNLFITDRENHVIRKISPAGDVSTFAGNGTQGYADGNGTNAQFNRPTEIAIDSDDNLYITDQQNFRVRKITPDGTVSTLAGTGETGYVDGDASIAQFSQLNGIAVDANDNVYLSDYDNYRVRKISPEGTVSTLAGNSTRSVVDGTGDQASFYAPAGLAADVDGNIFIADFRYIRKVSPSGEVSIIAGSDSNGNADGEGLSASFNEPHGVAIDSNGDLFVVEGANNLVRKVVLKDFALVGDSEGQLGTHEVSLKVTDTNGAFSTQDFIIEIFEADPPVFNSPENFQFDENLPLEEYAYAVSAQDQSEVSYSLGSGHDEGLFNMDGQYSNAIYFNTSPDYENPQDANGDNVYTIEIIATDAFGNTSSLLVKLTVTNVNESDPVISSITDLTIGENTKDITQIEATGFEDGFDISFSKSGGADLDAFFMTIDGLLSFRNAPDFEFPTDSDGDNVYQIEITAHVGERTSSKLFSVTVQDVLESMAPSIISEPVTTVNEGQDYSYSIETEDPDNSVVSIQLTSGQEWLKLERSYSNVETFAGSGNHTSENGQGINASFRSVEGITVDSEGNIYFAESGVFTIKKVDLEGNVTTFAGIQGVQGSQDGNLSEATFGFASAMTFDNNGNLFVADGLERKIRKISPDGVVTTVAGNGVDAVVDGPGDQASFSSPLDIAVDSHGNVFIAETNNHTIRKIDTEGNVSTFAGAGETGFVNANGTEAYFASPTSMVIDSEDNLIVADISNFHIRKITPNGDVTSYVGQRAFGNVDAQGEEARFSSPYHLAIDNSDNLYVTELLNFFPPTIRKVDKELNVTTIAGSTEGYSDGPVNQAQFGRNIDLDVDDNGIIYIADQDNLRIRRINSSWKLTGKTEGYIGVHDITLKATDQLGEEGLQSFQLTVRDITPPVFVTTPENSTFQEVNFTERGTGSVYQAMIEDDNPNGVVTFSIDQGYDGEFFTIDQNGLLTFKESPDFDTPLDEYADNTYEVIIIAEDGFGNTANLLLYVKVTNNISIGDPVFTSTPITDAYQNEDYSYKVEVQGEEGAILALHLSEGPDWLSLRNVQAAVTTIAGSGLGYSDGSSSEAKFQNPTGIAINSDGEIFIADQSNHVIRKLDKNGDVTTFAGNGNEGSLDGSLNSSSFFRPVDLVFDSEGNLFVADLTGHKIRKIDTNGSVTTYSGSTSGYQDGNRLEAKFYFPSGLAIDQEDNLYVVDANHVVRKISPNGQVTTLAGNGNSGDQDGTGSEARFNYPYDVYFSKESNLLLVSDYLNDKIKSVDQYGVVTTLAGSGPGYLDGEALTSKFNRPARMASDADGNIWVMDSENSAIRKIDENGTVSTLVGFGREGFTDGAFGEAVLHTPIGVVIDDNGDLIIAEDGNHRIRRVVRKSRNFLEGNPADQLGDYPVTLRVTDLGDGITDQSFTIRVHDRVPPDFISFNHAEFEEFSTGFAYQAAATDRTQISYSLGNNRDEEVFIISGNQISFISPPVFASPLDANSDNVYEIEVIATDDSNNSSSLIVSITVTEVIENVAPAFTSTPVTEINDDEAYKYLVNGFDADGDVTTITAETIPDWLSPDVKEAGIVSTFSGSVASTLRNGFADQASFRTPSGLAFDSEGNLYVADTDHHRIVKVASDGYASTFVGTGSVGYLDGPKEIAQLNSPMDIAFDSEGNMFISDHGNRRIRKVDLDGNVSTFAGNGETGFANGEPTSASFQGLGELIIDDEDNLYVVSQFSIRKVSPDGNVQVYAGGESFGTDNGAVTEATFGFISGIALDNAGNLFVSDFNKNKIRRISAEGMVTDFAGSGIDGADNGDANEASFRQLRGMAFGPDGQLYVADGGNYSIRRIDQNGSVITFSDYNGDDKFKSLIELEFGPDGQLYALDNITGWVSKILGSIQVENYIGGAASTFLNGNLDEANYNSPFDIEADGNGNYYVSDQQNNVIRKIDSEGNVTTFAGNGTAGLSDGSASEAMFNRPAGLALDQSGNLYVADLSNHVIRKILPDGTVTTYAGNGTFGFNDGDAQNAQFFNPTDVAVTSDGSVFVTDQFNNRIRRIGTDGVVSTYAGNGSTSHNPDDIHNSGVVFPTSIVSDENDNLYFTSGSAYIRKLEPSGRFTTIAGKVEYDDLKDGPGPEAKFADPYGLTIDANGIVYVADRAFNAIRRIGTDGYVSTLAGSQLGGLRDGASSEAKFRGPTGIAIDQNGDLIVADIENHRLRTVSTGSYVLLGSAVGQKGTYPVSLKITDESGAFSTQSFEIEVIDVTAPVFISSSEVEVEENTIESFFRVEATDSNQLEYSLGTEKDESLFIIDAQTGELSFIAPPDFESPQDADEDNSYEIVVFSSDGRNTSGQSISITVEDLDEVGPIVTLSSNSLGLVFTPSVTVNVSLSEEVIGLSEQSFTASNATITDFQGSGLSYSFVLSSLNDGPASVKVLENKVFDAAQNGNEVSNVLSFNFEARNAAPTGVTLSAATVSENITERVEVAVLGAEDGDEADQHTFRLVGGDGDTDNAKFNIIGNKLFKRNEVSFDFETQPTLSVRIQVSDIRGGSLTAVKTINVINVPEPSMSLKLVDATERELEVAGINFGRVKVGASQVRQVEVLNTSTDAELLVTEIKLTSGFTVSESIFTLGIGEKKVLNVTYLPQEPAVHIGKLELVTNAGNQSLSVAGSAFANKKPIAIAPEARISHIPGNILKLIGFDPDGDEIEFVITANPTLGSLEAQSGLGEYKFIPSGLAPETVYEDELKFKVVEKNGGLSSDEATLKFRFRIRDVKHTLLPIEIVSVDNDNMNIVVSFTDEVINNDYYLSGFYRGKEEGQTVFFSNNLKINKGDLTNTNGVLSTQIAVSRNDFPAMFTNSKLLLAVKLKTANGFESSNTRIFTRSNEGQLNGNAVSDGSTDDGDFSIFALDSTVPENESVNINISAVEFGDFDFSGATLQITKSPANGMLGEPVLVSNQNGLAQWTVSYTSTTEIGIEDSFEFSVVHPVRNETLTGTAKIEVIGVPDAPELSAIADQQVNEDETISFSIEASDVDSELTYTVVSSESAISGTVLNGKLNITASDNFYGSAVIQLVVTEIDETSPQSVSQSFNLTVLPVNDAPVVTAMADQQVNEDGEISVALAATDLDGDAGAFSYIVSSDSDANVSYSVENGSLKVKPAADFNGEINFTVKANDGSGTATAISAGENFKLTIVPVNDVPEVNKAFSTQTLIEGFVSYNLDLSKYFSDKETASSDLVYSISNLTNVAASINGKLLAISSVSGNTGLQTATVTASDGELSVSQQITFVTSAPSADVTIANVITDLNLDEDFGLQTVDLSNVFAYSLNANASFTYSLAGNQNVDVIVNGNNLEINSTENFNGSDVIYITATVDGKSNLTSFNINISPVNDAPTLVYALADDAILEDAVFSKVISSSAFNDVDGDALTYSASYNAAWLSFDATTRTFSGTPLNEDIGTVTVTVTAEDPSGSKVTDDFQIVISNTNDSPTNIGISASAFDENIDIGTAVATLSGTDPDVGDTNFTYALVSGTGDTDNASFQIVDGQLKTLSTVNYEAKNSYSIRVKITDGFEGTFEKVFTISVNNVNEVATDITLTTSSIAENQAAGAVIDGFATVDPDLGDTFSYSLVSGTGDNDNSSFEIVSGDLVSKAQFNYEEKSSYSVRVRSTDSGGLTLEKTITITVTDANDTPTAVTSTTLELPENSAIGTVIGEFSSTDEDTNDAHTYSLVTGEGDTDNASFEFDGANLKAKASFNFETKSGYSIRVQSSDGNGGTLESQFTVNVTNVLEVELRTESTITVPTIGMGETETVELILNNDGEDVLEITGINFPEAYSGSFTTASIAGGGSETLTITFEPTEAGTYAGEISITSNAGTHVVNITGEAEVVAGLEEPMITAAQVKLYPNPASQFVEIDLTDLNGVPADLSIKSINGAAMWSMDEVRLSKVSVDISSYADGAYLVLVQTERGTVTKRLLIKK